MLSKFGQYFGANMKRFITLDLFRGIAALIILMRHSIPITGFNPYVSYLAVDLFFLISGFVFVPSVGDRLLNGKMDAKGAIINRFIRLYPLYFLSVIFAAVCYLVGAKAAFGINYQSFWQAWLISLTMGPNLTAPMFWFQINGLAWYLFVDIAGVIILSFTYKYLNNWIIGAISLFSAIVLVWGAYNMNPHGGLDLGYANYNWQFGFARFGFSFMLGMLLFRILRNGFFEKQFNLPLVGALLCAILAACLCIQKIDRETDALISLVLTFAVFPILLILATKIDFGGWFGKISEFLSGLSYTIYVLQYAVIIMFMFILKQMGIRPHSIAPWGQVGLQIFMIGLSYVANKYYDAPVRAWLNSKLKPRKQ